MINLIQVYNPLVLAASPSITPLTQRIMYLNSKTYGLGKSDHQVGGRTQYVFAGRG
jgi:hypothetical protein